MRLLTLEMEDLLAEAQSLARLGSWEWDAISNHVIWSDELYRIYGLEPQTFPATVEGYLARIHTDDRARVMAAIQNALREGSSFDHEERIVRSDGEVRILHSRGRAILDDSGRAVRLVGTCQDITERRRAEEALRESETRFREVAENICEVFWSTTADFKTVLYVSPAFEKIFGIPATPMGDVLERWLRVIHPDDLEGVRTQLERSPDGPLGGTYRILRPDGTVRWILWRGSAVRDAAGKVLRVTGFSDDITDLKETEAALRQAQARLAEALHRSEDRVVQLEEQAGTRTAFERLVGKSGAMQEVYRKLRLAAQSDVTVLLTGESGTGKELAAAAVHSLSERRNKPFVAVNCSAIPETLLESELFGHVKGAFTGAVRDKAGLFQAADGGTLFLDEVGDMGAPLQVKVLRALQEREVRRVGDERVAKVDVRIIAATNRDLPKLVAAGKIREDFYYRIRVFDIVMPPLRDRREDIPLLIRHFLSEIDSCGSKGARGVNGEAMRALMNHAWPGNVRELRNALEHALVTAGGAAVTRRDLPTNVITDEPAEAWTPAQMADRQRVLAALEESEWNRTRAAALLGTSRVTLWKKMSRFGLQPPPAAVEIRALTASS